MKLARVSVFLCAACVWANVVFAQASQIRDRSTAAIQSTAKKQSHDKANPRITLRVEDFANLDPSVLAGARKVTTEIFAAAGVQTVWLDCPVYEGADCGAEAERPQIILRILGPSMDKDIVTDHEALGFATKDFDRILVIDDRTKLVARKVSDFLKESHDRFQKTIVFCVDEEHAARMRQALINENKDLCNVNHSYVMRITGSDAEGQAQLGNFIDPEAKYPVLVTTSRLLSTGVDAQTCRLIVLDRSVGSMTEFKQIVGRGTRVHEDTKNFYFTLIDFRGATNHFADPEFDGEPVQIYEPGQDDPIVPPDDGNDEHVPPHPEDDELIIDQPPDININIDEEPTRKIYVDGVGATIVAERVEYLDEQGRLVTETLRDFTKRALKKRYASLDDFLNRWKSAERKQAIIEELENEGLSLDPLAQGSRQGPRSLRSYLPRRFRPAAAHSCRCSSSFVGFPRVVVIVNKPVLALRYCALKI